MIRLCTLSLLFVLCNAKVIDVGRLDKRDETKDPPVFEEDGNLSDTVMKKLLSETNRYRLMHDATPLGNCPVCSEAAQKHADDIASSGVVKPDGKAKYGQIIFSTSDVQDTEGSNYFGTLAPGKIYDQIKNYDFVKSEFKENAADFSQLVWEGSEVAGFAAKKGGDGTVYLVMYFNPPGNNETMSFYENVNRVTGAGDIECGHIKCPKDWTLHSCNCYKYFDDEMTWPDAVDHCNILKSSLVSAESMEEGLMIRTMLMEKDKGAWIGMSDSATKGGFQFVDGTPYVYSDWSYESYQWLYAHPNDARSKCIVGTKDGWNYKECSDKLPAICKMRPNGVSSYALDLYFPGSTFTNELAMPGSQRHNTMKETIDRAFNKSYGEDIWFVGSTFFQFMPRDNGEVAASTMLKFAPDDRAPVDPITKLRDYLRKQNDLKILAVRLIPGIGRVTTISVGGGTCPSGCSGDCYPECNPVCCGAAVSLSSPAIPSGYTACPQYPGCGTPCQSSCTQSCCQQNPYQQMPMQPACPQFPGCSASCAPQCQQSCCQPQQPMMMPPCPPRCAQQCGPQCAPHCCQQQQPMMMPPPCPPTCAQQCGPQCAPHCCQQQQPMMMPPPCPPTCAQQCAPQCAPQCCQQQPPPMMMPPSCPPTCAQQCGPQCAPQCCQQQPPPMMMPPSCPPRCAQQCGPQCAPQCCQQQQPMMMSMMQPSCPQYPRCAPQCAPQCTPQCCQQQMPMMPQPQTLLVSQGPVIISQGACGSSVPGCSNACAPACRPSCCSNGMMTRTFRGKKRSSFLLKTTKKDKVAKHNKSKN